MDASFGSVLKLSWGHVDNASTHPEVGWPAVNQSLGGAGFSLDRMNLPGSVLSQRSTSRYWLVVYLPLWKIWKSLKVNGKDDIPYIMENMFQTTNQDKGRTWCQIYLASFNGPASLETHPIPIPQISILTAQVSGNYEFFPRTVATFLS